MMTIIMFIFPVERRGYALGITGLVISFAPALGPAVAGWLIEFLPWRSLFYMILPIALIDIVLAFFFMKNIHSENVSESRLSLHRIICIRIRWIVVRI